MYRHSQLIRRILLAIEPLPYPNEYISFDWKDYTPDMISYHVNLLHDSGLIQATENKLTCFDEWNDVRLTWTGHEFLELIRDEKVWKTTLDTVKKTTGGDSFELIQYHLLQHYQS